jgi:hypothetical protein
MAKTLTHAEFTRRLLTPYNETLARRAWVNAEFRRLGRQPSVTPKPLINPVDTYLIQHARNLRRCGCLKRSCPVCGFLAFHARVRSTERPLLNTQLP